MAKEIYEGDDLMQIMLSVPKNSIKLKIDATMVDPETDELFHAENIMPIADIIDARIAGWEWEGENVKYQLTNMEDSNV